MLDVALEVPLGPLPLGGRRQRDDPGDPGIQVLGDPLDRAALAGGVAALEDHHEPGPSALTHCCIVTSSRCRRSSSAS